MFTRLQLNHSLTILLTCSADRQQNALCDAPCPPGLTCIIAVPGGCHLLAMIQAELEQLHPGLTCQKGHLMSMHPS